MSEHTKEQDHDGSFAQHLSPPFLQVSEMCKREDVGTEKSRNPVNYEDKDPEMSALTAKLSFESITT